MAFINEDFILSTDAARELYHGSAENLPTWRPDKAMAIENPVSGSPNRRCPVSAR